MAAPPWDNNEVTHDLFMKEDSPGDFSKFSWTQICRTPAELILVLVLDTLCSLKGVLGRRKEPESPCQ